MEPNRFRYTHDTLDQLKRYLRGQRRQGVVNKPYFDLCRLMGNDVYFQHNRTWKKIVPEEEVQQVLQSTFNESPHLSRDGLFDQMYQNYVGISRRQCQTFLSNQETYQLRKPVPKAKTIRSMVADRPLSVLQFDIAEFPNTRPRFMFVVVDTFSKFVWATPIAHKDHFLPFLDRLLRSLPHPPKVVQSDNALEFKTHALDTLLKELGIHHRFSLPHTPQANGAVERLNRTIKEAIYKLMVQNRTAHWSQYLPRVVADLNDRVHSSTKRRPRLIQNEQRVREVERIRENLMDSRRFKRQAPNNIRVGDEVRIASSALPINRGKTFFKPRYRWTEEIYEVKQWIPPKHAGEYPMLKVNGVFYSPMMLQKVDEHHLVKRPPAPRVAQDHPPARPVVPPEREIRERADVPLHLRLRLEGRI